MTLGVGPKQTTPTSPTNQPQNTVEIKQETIKAKPVPQETPGIQDDLTLEAGSGPLLQDIHKCPGYPFFLSKGEKMIERAIDNSQARSPFARSNAVAGFKLDIKALNSEELAETRDTIVQRMSHEPDGKDRQFLLDLYHAVEAEMKVKESVAGKTVSSAVDDALNMNHAKMPGARQFAINGFEKSIKGLNDQELEDLKDYIVAKMAQEDMSTMDRDLLHELYNIVDQKLESPLKKIFTQPKWEDFVKTENKVRK